MDIFGKKVKELLKEEGLRQKELAYALGVKTTTLCEWLNGNNEPPLAAVLKIADFFAVSLDYLFGRECEDGSKQY